MALWGSGQEATGSEFYSGFVELPYLVFSLQATGAWLSPTTHCSGKAQQVLQT